MTADSPSPTVLVRTDASADIGTGHAMRCLALAEALRLQGAEVLFLMASSVDALTARIESIGAQVQHLNVDAASAADAQATIQAAQQHGAVTVVVDGYAFDSTYQQTLMQAGVRVLFVDDYGHGAPYSAAYVLNQNSYADSLQSTYQAETADTTFLLGPRYALLRTEFSQATPQRTIPAEAGSLLVSLGGADPDNITGLVVDALSQLNTTPFSVTVVLGGANAHVADIQAALAPLSRATCVVDAHNMPELMAQADLAVCAGGTTVYELAYMGVPALLTTLAENQRAVVESLSALGVAQSLGPAQTLSVETLVSSISELAANQTAREQLAKRGQALVDGEGAARVAQLLLETPLRLRPVREADCRLLWEWANEPETRAVSFSSDPIAWEDHQHWFASKYADPLCRLYIAVDADDQPLGQVRFDVESSAAVISVSLDASRRGQGFGTVIIQQASRLALLTSAVERIHAYIKPTNEGSARAFTKAGYAPQPPTTVQGQQALHFVLERDMLLP